MSLFLLFSCQQKQQADTLIINAKVYTVDADFSIAEAFAVKDGRFLEVGTTKSIMEKYHAKNVVDLDGKPVYPGFIDAHCHFWGYAQNLVTGIDLSGVRSFAEAITRLLDEREKEPETTCLRGFGWNFETWEQPSERSFLQQLDSIFPDIPVFLKRIDGHAAIVNTAAINAAQIEQNQHIEGGMIDWKRGIVLDNAMEPFKKSMPLPSSGEMIAALQTAQNHCFQYGLTSVHDAGLDKWQIMLIDSLQQAGVLKINVYAMLNPTAENITHFVEKGVMETDKLTVRSIKLYADGALGSRGTLLLLPYSDAPNHRGLQVASDDEIKTICQIAYKNQYQIAVHCIGDAANRLILNIFSEILPENNPLRWRIEHAQVIHPNDIATFEKFHIIPSVQPTHAISDMIWAEQRLGKERLEHAYRLQDLLKINGWLPLGTDFPVEQIDPKQTFFAAVTRKDNQGEPASGFLPHQALTRQEALRGMTIWAAKAAFEERKKGSIEAGKNADFIILDRDLMTIPEQEILETKVLETWIGGENLLILNF
jgi:predicted amidohydrolase YtcJ